MQAFNCIIADDEPLARQLIQSFVEQVPYLHLKGVFKNAWEVREYLIHNQADILFLDIEMPGLDGLTMVKSISKIPYVIFITAHRNYAVEAFEVKALDYLVKPVSFERFLKALYPIEQQHSAKIESPKTKDHLFVSVDRQMVKIFYADVLYLEAMGDYVKFYTNKEKPIISKMTLKEAIQLLQSPDFLQIHRSFVVNKQKITAYTQDKIRIGETWLKLSRSYKSNLEL
ncbi:MAG: response regulator transcription factor [Cyclobacteriaceae bacterium]|nr:response regulator transcription factor [Cyclobacteriaceae bacterium]